MLANYARWYTFLPPLTVLAYSFLCSWLSKVIADGRVHLIRLLIIYPCVTFKVGLFRPVLARAGASLLLASGPWGNRPCWTTGQDC